MTSGNGLNPRRYLIVLLSGYWGLIFCATHVPLPDAGHSVDDKVIHCCAFALLAFLMTWLISTFRPTAETVLIVLAVTMAYGAADELTQQLSSTRTSEIRDWYADVAGAALGLSGYLIWNKVRSWHSAAIWSRKPL